MNYKNITDGIFRQRLNRFEATVEICGKAETVHVKNTGRCKELLVPGCKVFLERSENPNRKNAYDITAVEKKREGKPPLLINMDSQIPNAAAEEWLKKGNVFSKNAEIRREVKFENSRFDFYVEDCGKKAFLEVKGVTLEKDGIALFPDAPTTRGVKHINELISAKERGFDCYILFVIQMKEISAFMPNRETHPEFADALLRAKEAGVEILAFDCAVTPKSMVIEDPVEIKL